MFTIDEILKATNGELLKGEKEIEIKNVHFDSRKIKEKGLFIALTKGQNDGHYYIDDAMDNGAIAAIVSQKDLSIDGITLIYVQDTEKALQSLAEFYKNKLTCTVIGITGSNGKTTTKDIVAGLLSTTKRVHKTVGNLNNHLGLPLTILQAKKDTEVLVLEMGMNHYGEIDLLASIAKPDFGIITNIGDAHIEFFGTRENIAKAKTELLPHVKETGAVLLNMDQEFKEMAKSKTKAKAIFYGEVGELKATDISYNENGTDFKVIFEEKMEEYRIPLYGKHNIQNTLPAIYIAKKLGLSKQEIEKGLKDLKISPMRFEIFQTNGKGTIINDAYNASPTSMKASISTFIDIFKEKEKIIVLGDMFELGEDEIEYHKEIGYFLNQYKNQIICLVTIGENSKHIHQTFDGKKVHFNIKSDAIKVIREMKKKENVMLFKASRGMKLEEIIKAID